LNQIIAHSNSIDALFYYVCLKLIPFPNNDLVISKIDYFLAKMDMGDFCFKK
jgi:hypothetical protein